jgi:hypothetical protein
MIVESLLAGGILLHELTYIVRDGRVYLERCFVPTFGLQLGPRTHASLHLALMAACAAMVAVPAAPAGHIAVLALLSLVIASYSLRLSNHLVVAWFLLVVVLQADAASALGASEGKRQLLVLSGFELIVVTTYALSAFHKLNREFFSPAHSPASHFARFLCADRGVRSPTLVRVFSCYSILSTFAVEACLPVLLLVPPTRPWALLLAVGFHFSLALLGIVNFSAVMYAGLAAFLPVEMAGWSLEPVLSRPAPVVLVACVLAIGAVWLVTPRRAGPLCPYRYRNAAWVVQVGFGALTAWFVLEAAYAVTHGTPVSIGDFGDGLGLVLVPVLALYVLNGLAPYVGYKTEFSLAMFSSLRTRASNHLVFRERWRLLDGAQYLRLHAIEALPGLDAVAGDPAAEVALETLSKPEHFEYRPYFLFEAIRCLSRVSGRGQPISARVTFRGCEYDVMQGSAPAGFPRWRRVNAFPFVLPLDEQARHSEQGSIISADGRRQLF